MTLYVFDNFTKLTLLKDFTIYFTAYEVQKFEEFAYKNNYLLIFSSFRSPVFLDVDIMIPAFFFHDSIPDVF